MCHALELICFHGVQRTSEVGVRSNVLPDCIKKWCWDECVLLVTVIVWKNVIFLLKWWCLSRHHHFYKQITFLTFSTSKELFYDVYILYQWVYFNVRQRLVSVKVCQYMKPMSYISYCKVKFLFHDDVNTSKHSPRYWPFVRGIHRSQLNSHHKGQWRRALMFYMICALTNSLLNSRDAGDLRRHCTHYDVTIMWSPHPDSGVCWAQFDKCHPWS